MGVFAKWFFDFWLANCFYNSRLAIISVKPYIYFPKSLEKWFYSVNYSLGNNQETSVGIAFIARCLRKPFAPVAHFKLKCSNMKVAFHKNIVCYSKAWDGKLRTANTKHIVLQFPLFKEFVLKHGFCSFVSNACGQILARIMRGKRNVFNSAYMHIGEYRNLFSILIKNMGVVKTCKELVALIEHDGWHFVRQTGSHSHYKHSVKQGIVTIPMHNKDIKKGTANSILKQAGLK